MNTASNRNCACRELTDPLHCNKCDHIFCGSCQAVFKQVRKAYVIGPQKKSCPNCASTDLYRKPSITR